MTEQPSLEQQLASLSVEERARVEDAAEKSAAAQAAADEAFELAKQHAEEAMALKLAKIAELESALYDERQDGKLADPRDLGPVGGSHVG